MWILHEPGDGDAKDWSKVAVMTREGRRQRRSVLGVTTVSAQRRYLDGGAVSVIGAMQC
jgi:hypothetical protein